MHVERIAETEEEIGGDGIDEEPIKARGYIRVVSPIAAELEKMTFEVLVRERHTLVWK